MSLALYLQCSCPTEPTYSTSEQPRQSTLTNQTQPETRQPASPSLRNVNHGATSQCPFFIRALYSQFPGCANQSHSRPDHRALLQTLRSNARSSPDIVPSDQSRPSSIHKVFFPSTLPFGSFACIATVLSFLISLPSLTWICCNVRALLRIDDWDQAVLKVILALVLCIGCWYLSFGLLLSKSFAFQTCLGHRSP